MMRCLLALAAAICLLGGCSRRPSELVTVPTAQHQAVPDPAGPRGPLPAELAPFQTTFKQSELTYVATIPTKEKGTAPWRSKFLGVPYLPKGQQHPRGANGKPLALLAQINFAEMPSLPDYPPSGIVQFFVANEESNEHIYGSLQYMEKAYDESRHFASMLEQRYFKVRFWPEIVTGAAAQGSPEDGGAPGPGLPIAAEASLRFELRMEAVSVYDYRFKNFLGKPASQFFQQFGTKEAALAEGYMAYAGNWPVAKVGGYSRLVQRDPRESRPGEDWLILLEIRSASDGVDKLEIMWGDSGTGTFFIRRADLKKRDFSKVAYYWDNH